MKEGEANSKYCFAPGDDGENKCMDSEATTPSAAGTSQGAGGASPSSAAPAGAPTTAAPAGVPTTAAAPTGGKSGQLCLLHFFYILSQEMYYLDKIIISWGRNIGILPA